MNELVDFALAQLEAADQVDVDRTFAEPFEWKPNTLYGYLLPAVTDVTFETGPTAQRQFVARFIYVYPSSEPSDRVRDPDVSKALDDKRTEYLDVFRQIMSAPPFWDFAEARETEPPATLQTRAVSLQLTGYRIVS